MHVSVAIAAACLLCAAASSGAARRQVILTTDCGTEMDDQWALAQLALSAPKLDLLGVVTTHAPNVAPPAAEYTAKAARDVLDHLPLSTKPPVFAGSSEPLADAKMPRLNAGVQFILDHSRGHGPDNRLAVLAIGAATDVASVLLADPSAADRIEVVAMGYLDWVSGGNEWNVHNDVKAWQVILSSNAPVTVGDQAVCKQDLLMDDTKANALFGGRWPASDYVVDILTKFVTTNAEGVKSMTGLDHTWPVWDSVTVAYLLGFTTAAERPRPTLGDDCIFRHGSAGSPRTIRWITHVDAARLWADFGRKLGPKRD